MKGIIAKNWEALALRHHHKTSFRKPLPVPAEAELLRQENGKLIFSTGNGAIRACSLAAKPGDVLFVKEAWRVGAAHRYEADARIEFKAGGPNVTMRFLSRYEYDSFISRWEVGTGRWNGPVLMPPEAARFLLLVADIRVERLQIISDEDCIAEGIHPWTKDGRLFKYYPADFEGDYPSCTWDSCPFTPKDAMRRVWDKSCNSQRQLWKTNPWVQVIHFDIVNNSAFAGELKK